MLARWVRFVFAVWGSIVLLLAMLTLCTFASGRPAMVAAPAPGEPCGSGELLPAWAICLHGTISLGDAGQLTAQDGVPVTVTLGDRSISGVSFVHPGQTIPTYGLDISPLEPTFLQPVTLTAVVDGRE